MEVVTNGTVTSRINELVKLPPQLTERLFYKISFHYKELKRLCILDKFFDDVRKIHCSGASFTLELMAYDGIEDDIDDICAICKKNVGLYATRRSDEMIKGGIRRFSQNIRRRSSAKYGVSWIRR